MSNPNLIVPHEQVIPVIESSLFDDHSEARYAVGVLAIGDQVKAGLENEYQGYYDLRKKVYVDQMGHIDETELDDQGMDRDEDDARSVAFGIIENRGSDQRVVAATRLIIKGFNEDPENNRELPVEKFFPEVFEEEAPTNSIEVSRLIARHERVTTSEILRWRLYASVLSYIDDNKLGPTYGIVESWLKRHLNSTIPMTDLSNGQVKYIEHYQSENLPIEVHTDKFIKQMGITHPGVIDEMQALKGAMSYFGKKRKPASVKPLNRNIPVPASPERAAEFVA